MKNPTRFLVLAAAVIASVASILGPEDDIPPPDSCQNASASGALSLVFVEADGDQIIDDFQAHPPVFGNQGAGMITMRFRVEGDAVPECASFQITLEHCLNRSCSQVNTNSGYVEDVPLRTYEDGEARITREYFQILPWFVTDGSLLRLRVGIGAIDSTLMLWVGREGDFVDAGPFERDGGIADAAADAAPPDGMAEKLEPDAFQ